MTADYFKNNLCITPAQLANLPLANNHILLFDATALDVSKFNLPDYLSPFELSVINRRKSPQAKQEYLATRILLKQLLKIAKPQYANTQLNGMSTQFDEASAKLQLQASGEIFNTCISHSHGLVGVALNLANTEFGFDIEKISLKRPFEKLAKHFYHADEIALITEPSNTQTQANIFFRIWTLKESLAKATSRPIAKLLSPNVFNELNIATLSASSNCVTVESNNQHTQFDVTVAHKKSTDWRCFLITDFIL
ncbi:4'-phosphopantetheinyl transferase family protein [Pseudoalteromonas espejiana]